MDLLLFLSSLLVLCEMAVGLMRQYIYIYQAMNWSNAQSYCRKSYTDLATITTNEENQRAMMAITGLFTYFWIGMNRTLPASNTWQWSDGEQPQYFKWKINEPNNYLGNENCVSVTQYGWNDCNCLASLPFLCHRSLVLVKENKTWDEALNYCRKNYTGLLCLTAESKNLLSEITATQNETVGVWLGLHFLDGKWVWVNGKPLDTLVSLPSCPAQGYRCLAYNTKANVWENRDCHEKLSFICY